MSLEKTIEQLEVEIKQLKEDNHKLKFMVENGLGYEDLTTDISPIPDYN